MQCRIKGGNIYIRWENRKKRGTKRVKVLEAYWHTMTLHAHCHWCFHRFLIMKVLIYRFFLNKVTALIVGVFSRHYETSLRCVGSWAWHWVAAWDTATLAALLCKAGWEVNWSHAGPCQGSNSFTNTTNTFRTSTIVYCTHFTMRNVCCKNVQVGNN